MSGVHGSADRSPQIGRLARLLHVRPEEIQGLEGVSDASLKVLHDLAADHMYGHAREDFAQVAALSTRLPGPLAAKLAERFLPPRMAARVTEQLRPDKARELASSVSLRYLVEIALTLDPSRCAPVLRAVRPHLIGGVAEHLLRRGEYAAMAEFASVVTYDALRLSLDKASARDLIALVPLLDWNEELNRVVDELPDARIDALLLEIADFQLWDDGERVLRHLDPAVVDRAARRAGAVSETLIDAFRAADAAGLLGEQSQALLARAEALRAAG